MLITNAVKIYPNMIPRGLNPANIPNHNACLLLGEKLLTQTGP